MVLDWVATDTHLYRITVLNRGQVYRCPQGENLLAGMVQQAASCIDIGCRGGGCGMCKIRIVEGRYRYKRMSRLHVSIEEEKQGFALSCRVIPCSDMVIESDHFSPALT